MQFNPLMVFSHVESQKDWQKTTWVKFPASPVASTNQILIEDVSQVAKKVTKKASNQCQVK